VPGHAGYPLGAEQRREWVLAALERYEAALVRYAMRLVGDEDAARDAVQHAFLRLCEQPPEAVEGHVAPWLFAVCRNKAVDCLRLRRRAGGHRLGAGDLELPHCPSRETDPATAVERRDLHQRLSQLVDRLPRGQREAITLWAEGFPYGEIAEILSTTEGNVRVLMHRAIKRLRQHPLVRHLIAGSDAAQTHRAPDPAREVPR
jgi:RNA polymerase sigma factor (sigma-70 family)